MTTTKGYAHAGEPGFDATLATVASLLAHGVSQAAITRAIGVAETTMAEWIRYHFPEHRWRSPEKTERNSEIRHRTPQGGSSLCPMPPALQPETLACASSS